MRIRAGAVMIAGDGAVGLLIYYGAVGDYCPYVCWRWVRSDRKSGFWFSERKKNVMVPPKFIPVIFKPAFESW